jgi:hypothetical protein
MQKICPLFVEKKTYKIVYLYMDIFGNEFMANKKFGRRMKINQKRRKKC